MKPFNLKKAKAGEPVCTRGGRSVRIICFNRKHNTNKIAALICNDNNEELTSYTENGERCVLYETEDDLMMAPEKKTGWINIYKSGDTPYSELIHKSKEAALECCGPDTIDTIQIEWEE